MADPLQGKMEALQVKEPTETAPKPEENNTRKKDVTGNTKFLVAHWNVGGYGDHFWDSSGVAAIASKVDLLLLSDTKEKVPNYNWLGDNFHCKEYKEGPYRLTALIRKGKQPLKLYHDPIGNFVWMYIDLKIESKIHRFVLTYGPSGDDVKDSLPKLLDLLNNVKEEEDKKMQEEASEKEEEEDDEDDEDEDKGKDGNQEKKKKKKKVRVNFVHFLGDNNNEADVIKPLLPGYEFLLEPTWKTSGLNGNVTQIDHIFSKSFGCPLKNHVCAHKPFNPYDLVKKVGSKEETGFYKMELSADKSQVQLQVNKNTAMVNMPSRASVNNSHPTTFHKVLLLEVGDNLKPCFAFKGKNCVGDPFETRQYDDRGTTLATCDLCSQFTL